MSNPNLNWGVQTKQPAYTRQSIYDKKNRPMKPHIPATTIVVVPLLLQKLLQPKSILCLGLVRDADKLTVLGCQIVLTTSFIEGLEFQAEPIPRKKLSAAWKTLSQKPLPKVRMLQLSDEDFNHVLQHRRCLEDDLREIEEWGRVLSTKGTDACIFNADGTDSVDYIILVRQNPYHSLQEIILHELGHIARGDL